MAEDDWANQMERLEDKRAKRREKMREQEREGEAVVREAEERHDRDKPTK
jgi:hypothetical protein